MFNLVVLEGSSFSHYRAIDLRQPEIIGFALRDGLRTVSLMIREQPINVSEIVQTNWRSEVYVSRQHTLTVYGIQPEQRITRVDVIAALREYDERRIFNNSSRRSLRSPTTRGF